MRLATEADVPALAALIPRSVRRLQAVHYSPAQLDAALGPVFGVESDGVIAGRGGWSRRKAVAERYEVPMRDGLRLPVVRMTKESTRRQFFCPKPPARGLDEAP